MKVWQERDHSEEGFERARFGIASAQLLFALFLTLFSLWLIDYTKGIRDLHMDFRRDVRAVSANGGTNE